MAVRMGLINGLENDRAVASASLAEPFRNRNCMARARDGRPPSWTIPTKCLCEPSCHLRVFLRLLAGYKSFDKVEAKNIK